MAANEPMITSPNTTSFWAKTKNPSKQASANSAAANANHLICSRSTPRERRKRSTSEATASRIDEQGARARDRRDGVEQQRRRRRSRPG